MVTMKKQTISTPKSMIKPYKEKYYTQEGTDRPYIVREFSPDVEDDELVWHRDENFRHVTVLGGHGWKLQMDDELPTDLVVGKQYYIAGQTYHRVIKGEGNLVVRIENI